MLISRVITTFFIFFSLSISAFAYEHPGGMHPKHQIDFVKERIQQKQQPFYQAYLQLIAYADSALLHENHALADFNVPGYYVEQEKHRANSKSLQSDAFDAYACALAYQLGGEEKYADKSLDFLMVWANTNTKYSNDDGSLVMAYSGTAMIMAAELLCNDEAWIGQDKENFSSWTFPTLMKPQKKYKGNINQDLETLRARVTAELMEPTVHENEIANLINTLQDNGSWPDINYEDVSRTGFEHARHLENMVELSRAYKKPESKFYGDPQLKKTIDASLIFWLEHNFICENWWWNQIVTPDRLVCFLIIMYDELTEVQKEKAAPIVGRANLSAWGARPGGDLIKIAGILGKYALFTRDGETLDKVVNTMASEIAFATDRNTPEDLRGLQADMSFHHRHDRVNNTLSYGLGYANAFAEWAAKVADTRFRFPDEKIELLVDYYLDGICKMMVYGKYPDPGAKNRSISRKGTLKAEDTHIPEYLLKATDYRKDELEEIIQIRKGEIKPDLTSDRFYWQSEYLSHQRPDYFTSVRMFSSRNHSMEEPYNGEGLKNHHLGDGANFISRTGEEYMDIFPVLDWQKIPGTTVVQKPALPSEKEIQKKGLTDFVGAASDGKNSVAGFDFKSPLDPLEAKKAWFLFDEEYVCLGAGIHAEADSPVTTTLNQCYLQQEVTIKKANRKTTLDEGEHELKKVSWLYHDSIAYLFPKPTDVHLKNQDAKGSWYSINRQSDSPKEEISKELFTLWLDHGNTPQDASYAYIVLPAVAAGEVEEYSKNLPVKILANTPEIQAVTHTGLGISQMVFYQPGEIQLTKDLTLSLESPGMVMIQTNGQSIKKITVADPSRKLDTMHLKVSSRVTGSGDNFKAVWNEAKGYSDITVGLPQNEYSGKSVVIEM